ncbi:hypothetical protein ACNKHO_02685 [Shigella flexneri]
MKAPSFFSITRLHLARAAQSHQHGFLSLYISSRFLEHERETRVLTTTRKAKAANGKDGFNVVLSFGQEYSVISSRTFGMLLVAPGGNCTMVRNTPWFQLVGMRWQTPREGPSPPPG